MLHIDDLIEPRPEQILFSRRLVLFGRIVPSDAAGESLFALKGNPKNEIASFRASGPQSFAISQIRPCRKKVDSRSAA